MNRRRYVSSVVGAAAGLSGCAAVQTGPESSEEDERVTLRAVRVQNDSDRTAEVDITVVRNGANQFWSQFDIPADGRKAANTIWPTSGESFVVVCQCSTYTSTEIASLEHENNDRGVPYEVRFVIEETGDIEQRLRTVEVP